MAAKRRDRGKGAEGTESAAAAEAERKRICDIIDSFRYTGGGRIGDRESLVASDPGTETKPTAASAPVKSRARRSAFAAAPKPKATAKDRDKAKAKTKPKRRSTLTVAEKRLEAYLKVPPNFNFKPPRSRHRLLQEDHAFDPWRVIVLCMLLNVTTGSQVHLPLSFWHFVERLACLPSKSRQSTILYCQFHMFPCLHCKILHASSSGLIYACPFSLPLPLPLPLPDRPISDKKNYK